MRAGKGRVAVKTGAEGVYAGIVPAHGLGIALKIDDGAGRAAETAIAFLLDRMGLLPDRDAVREIITAPVLDTRDTQSSARGARPQHSLRRRCRSLAGARLKRR